MKDSAEPMQLDALMPMHLRLQGTGQITSAGPIMRRMLGQNQTFEACFIIERQFSNDARLTDVMQRVGTGERIFLRLRDNPEITLRGHGIALQDGVLLNFGFGIALVEAVRHYALTAADFAPSDLAMEFLFLHEANHAVMGELARANRRLEEAREAAETLALTDALTGLWNRRGFETALEQAALNSSMTPFALAQLDLDYFKQVNDRYGHATGDDVLQHVAQILRSETRTADRVARVGGDEFLLLLMNPGTTTDLENMARRIIRRIEQPIEFEKATCCVSASIGFSQSQHYSVVDTVRMLADADAALYVAKDNGRGGAHLASPSAA